MLRAVTALLLLILAPWVAHAEKRVALVIGNSAYQHASELPNPRNDANDMAATLKALGIEVFKGLDLDKKAMDRELRNFSTALSKADVGIFFYSGHGLQVSGNNYLVPVDAELTTADALEWEMVRLDLVQRLMEGKAKINILFLDACRNNPLSRNLARALGTTRSAFIGKGFAPAESGVGTLISFSTQPGNVAEDGAGRNSPYSGPLVRRIGRPGDDIITVLTDVRNEVLVITQEKQVPWENHALRARYYFNGATVVQPMSPKTDDAERAWKWVKDTTSHSVLENFIKEFGETPFGAMARARLAELTKQPPTDVPPKEARCRKICVERRDYTGTYWLARIVDQPREEHTLRIEKINGSCGRVCTLSETENWARHRSRITGKFYYWRMPPAWPLPFDLSIASSSTYREDWAEYCQPGFSWIYLIGGVETLVNCPRK